MKNRTVTFGSSQGHSKTHCCLAAIENKGVTAWRPSVMGPKLKKFLAMSAAAKRLQFSAIPLEVGATAR